MKKFLPKTIHNPRGFTLVELLIVVTIIAILTAVGYAVYSNLYLQQKSRNVVRRADIDAIAKALEVNKTSTYVLLDNSQFSNGVIPKDPLSTQVYCANASASDQPGDITSGVGVCAPAPAQGVTGYETVSSTKPPAGTKWKICAWLEDEDGAGVGAAAKAYCKVSAQ